MRKPESCVCLSSGCEWKYSGWMCFRHTPSVTSTAFSSPSRSLPFITWKISLSLSPMAAAIHSHAFYSPIAQSPRQHRYLAGLISLPSVAFRSTLSSFNGVSLRFHRAFQINLCKSVQMARPTMMMVKPTIQFIQGTDEQTIPDVRLTKSRDGTNGVATFIFNEPSVFDSSGELGDITGFYMIDEEGVIQSVDVSAKFVNGKPSRIEAKYIMRNPREWDRFMRFMERYSNANGLQFIKK